jgi:chromosome segregation and condensation protein ScpB
VVEHNRTIDSLRTVHKLIERHLIRPRLRRTGRSLQRTLTREQLLYLRLEAKGVQLLPMATRRSIARKIEKSPEIDDVCLTEGSVLVVQIKSARLELD